MTHRTKDELVQLVYNREHERDAAKAEAGKLLAECMSLTAALDAANLDAQTLYDMLRDVGIAAHTARCKAELRSGNSCVCDVDKDLAAHQARVDVKR